MISIEQFFRCHREALSFSPDPEKRDAIAAPPGATLYLVAGPGTGKTACLAARVLKLMLVDDIPPTGIIATTFTKKAAAELRSRILDWGYRMTSRLAEDGRLSASRRRAAANIDVNQLVTGTIDSLCQDMLLRYRDPGTQPPVIIDEFVARTLLLRHGLFPDIRYRSKRLDDLLLRLDARSNRFGWHLGRKTDVLSAAADRIIHDRVDRAGYCARQRGDELYARKKLLEAVEAYRTALDDRLMLDYARLEEETLQRLDAGQLSTFLERVQAVLVDEYQDTNLLQEQIYFRLSAACNGALTVVGDDDQSLFRFRGATVELFSRFPSRTHAEGWTAKPVFLKTNHRSTRTIVRFVDRYGRLDPSYQAVRAQDKPRLRPRPGSPEGLPILGMFRATEADLAADLADFLVDIFSGRGFRLPNGERIRADRTQGAIGDACLLSSTPRETNSSGRRVLPGLLRDALREASPPIEVFNPRGEALQDIDAVAAMGGLILNCLDPDGRIENLVFLPRETQNRFAAWRAAARTEVTQRGSHLEAMVRDWGTRGRARSKWPNRVSALELLYNLAYFFPELHDDPEGHVYLEAFARQLSACEQVSGFRGRIVINPPGTPDKKGLTLADHSVEDLLQDFLGPIAAGNVEVNEDLIEDFPRDRLSILSIHQAKGLEFPLAIVDVGSAFGADYPVQRFRRYPDHPTSAQAMEDHFRPHTPLGLPSRSALDRAFDDLYRLYFVAFSRARDVLLMVGLNSSHPSGQIPNVATGWERTYTPSWAARPPFTAI